MNKNHSSISKLTKWRFEKGKIEINKLIRSHFESDIMLKLLDDYNVEEIMVDSYDEPDKELCTWQDPDIVGNWGQTQEGLNHNFVDLIKKLRNDNKSHIDIDDYYYVYADGQKMVLYFAFRTVERYGDNEYTVFLTKK